MIDRVDCPAKQRDRIRMGTVHYSGNTPQVHLVRQGSHLSREVVDTHQVRTQRAHGLLVQPGIPVHFL